MFDFKSNYFVVTTILIFKLYTIYPANGESQILKNTQLNERERLSRELGENTRNPIDKYACCSCTLDWSKLQIFKFLAFECMRVCCDNMYIFVRYIYDLCSGYILYFCTHIIYKIYVSVYRCV